ncbi:hypothetical protein CEUSTIGMA_g7620.t1 [Chlamydomonas eustigma]|uniref:Fumarylacetoacetase n=1 Tax=Chlamydomonas eustigma TaxID=1157962 RepID=A0A250XBC6_9CHLO|nr:hypothetical protein CEUSTIGMA_g7620.t1 [Chlamydomonas eustigma]|eukprot:GAX80182.1 hypothetical protein CEUSTIGMA_g7620.t1 [Chlamydomonas eustigma]
MTSPQQHSLKETKGSDRNHIGVALGQQVIDVGALQEQRLFTGPILSQKGSCFRKEHLNEFMSLGTSAWAEARATLQRLLSSSEGAVRDNRKLIEAAVVPLASVAMQLPAQIGDYTDFYVSKQHAFNCGALFRGPGHELQPNWVHMPVAYHGRSSSILVSGQNIKRPWGQALTPGSLNPEVVPSKALDFELEMGCFIGSGNGLGESIPVDGADSQIFGMVLLNDWTARDIQKWEYVPLGPFNGKNFATQISPWIVTSEALKPFLCEAPEQQPPVLPYLQESKRSTYDIHVAADIIPAGSDLHYRVARTNFQTMYFTWPQMIAHHTLGGCNLRPGDLLGSGTISGGGPGQRGCLLEATCGGREPLQLTPVVNEEVPQDVDDTRRAQRLMRTYLNDGDMVIMSGWCENSSGEQLSFGTCQGAVLPSHKLL